MIARLFVTWVVLVASVLLLAFAFPPPAVQEQWEAPDVTSPAPAPTPSRHRDPAPYYADDEPALVSR